MQQTDKINKNPPAFAGGSGLYIEQEVDDVAVLHDIFLAFAADQALGLGGGHGAASLHVLKGDDFSPDEAALKVGVDLAGSLGRLSALLDGPCTALIGAGSRSEIYFSFNSGTLTRII